MRILFSAIIMISLSFVFQKNVNKEVTNKYCNARFEFCIAYPTSLFDNNLVADNGDGIILSSDENQVSATVFGSWNLEERTPKELYNKYVRNKIIDDSESELVFKEISNNDYEVSYENQDKQYYQKLFFKEKKFILLIVESPLGNTDRIDSVIKELDIQFVD